jgi:hypothetical protein
MRYRLRYMHHDLELTIGEFAIGRHASCQLSLDDALVSRRHAVLTVEPEHVFLEDLQSRNGVLVNGVRIQEKRELVSGDKVTIGSQEMTLLAALGAIEPATTPRGTVPRLEPRDSLLESTSENPTELDRSVLRRADTLTLLSTVAEKSLALGRADDAERILSGPLKDIGDSARAGKVVSASAAETAAKLAAKLAGATGRGLWVDYIVDVYMAQRRPCPAPVIDELYTAMRKVNGVDSARFRAYLAFLRERLASWGPAERFLVQRLEGLEKLAQLR